MKKSYLFFVCFSILSCDFSFKKLEIENKEKELELRERELELREKELLPPNADDKSLSKLFKENVNSVFLIVTNNEFDSSQGSGFFIREDGLGVSNYHVLENAKSAIIRTYEGTDFMISEIISFSKEKDYVVFKIANSKENRFKPVTFAKRNPEIGEDCFAIGNPYGLTQTLSQGIISGYRDDYIQTTAQITHGSSGGALFNRNGEVIGITTKGMNEADLNFAINTVNFKILEEESNKIQDSPNVNEKNYSGRVIMLLESYFNALSNDDFETLNLLFADKFSRFYNDFGFTKQQAIDDHINYAKKYPKPKCLIDYNTISMNKDYDGSVLVNLHLDFTIKGNDWKRSKTFTYDMFVKFDPEFKINSVFTNIIDTK